MKHVRLLYALLTVMCLSWFAASAAAQTPRPLPETFVSADETLTLRYPTGWAVDNPIAGQVSIATSQDIFNLMDSELPSGEAGVAVIFPLAMENFTDTEGIYVVGDPLATVDNIVKTLTQDSTAQAILMPSETIIFHDHPAARVRGSIGDNTLFIIAVDYEDGTFSIVVGLTTKTEFAKFEPKLLAIAESVNYLPPTE